MYYNVINCTVTYSTLLYSTASPHTWFGLLLPFTDTSMSPDCSEEEKGEGNSEEWTRRKKGIEGREREVKKGGIGQVEGREERRGER
jgi:hypothetical protein